MIWGIKPKASITATGQFNCPQCKEDTHYLRKQINYYRVIFAMPLVKTKDSTLLDYIECRNCEKQFYSGPNLVLDSSARI